MVWGHGRTVDWEEFGYPGSLYVPIRIPIFNDPGKEFEVQLIGPDLEQLRLEQVTQQLRALGESRQCSL